MANNFRLTGGIYNSYVSKDGNDGNSGLTADLPKVTLQIIGSRAVIGSGQYKGAFTLATGAGTKFYFADGLVKILMTADMILQPNDNVYRSGFNPVAFVDPLTSLVVIDMDGFDILARRGQENCRVVYIGGGGTYDHVGGSTTDPEMIQCVFDCNIDLAGSTADWSFDFCQFFGSSFGAVGTLMQVQNSYADSLTTLTMSVYFSTPSSDFRNNNWQGIIDIGGVLYELKQDADGNAIDPNPSVNDLIDIDATVYDRGNFSQDPEFLNVANRDYWSVEDSSPMIFGANDSTNIAKVTVPTMVKATDTEFTSPVSSVDLTTSGDDIIYDTGAIPLFGTVVSQPIQIAPIAQNIERVDFAEGLDFDSLETAGTSQNTDVVISDNYATTTAGANPRRLTYELRWTDSVSEPAIDADWTNGGLVTAGDYSKFEHFTVPKIDQLGIGNGDPTYDINSGEKIKATWVQVRIVIFKGIG